LALAWSGHRLVEDEFFDRESFAGPADFWRKATTYWHYFNLVRPQMQAIGAIQQLQRLLRVVFGGLVVERNVGARLSQWRRGPA
jgi:hypothetical protein